MAHRDIAKHIEQATLAPDVRQVCLSIVRSLSKIAPESAKFLPYPMLRDLVGTDTGERNLWPALTYLATFEHAILDAHGYILGTEGDIIPLDDEDFFEFSLSGDLVHPETGELIENARKLVYPYFSLVVSDLSCD